MTVFKHMRQNQDGFSLIELLLVVVVMAVLMAGAMQIFNDWIEKSTNRTAVRQMLLVQNAAEEYVSANFAAILATIPNEDDVDTISLATLRGNGYLPQNFPDRNIFRQSLRIVLINGGVADKGQIIQTLTLSGSDSDDQRVPETRLLDAAAAGGPNMGFYSRRTQGEIRSAYAEWSIEQSDIQTAYNPADPDDRNGGYLAAYGQVSVDDIAQSDYLYRVPMFDAAGNRLYQLNRMATDLDMGGNAMQAAAAMTVDQMRVNGGMDILAENITTAGFNPYALSVDEVLSVSGDNSEMGYAFSENSSPDCRFVTIAGEIIVDDSLVPVGQVCQIVGGQITVHGDADDLTPDVTIPDMQVDGASIADVSNVQNTPTFGEAQFDQVNANTVTAGRVIADELSVSGTALSAQQLRTGSNADFDTMAMSAGHVIAADINMPGNGEILTSGNMTAEQSYESYGNLWARGGLNAIRNLDMDRCRGHAACFDPNLGGP